MCKQSKSMECKSLYMSWFKYYTNAKAIFVPILVPCRYVAWSSELDTIMCFICFVRESTFQEHMFC